MSVVARWRADLWRVPLLLGGLTVTGLLCALIGDGLWDVLSWVTLGLPTLVGLGFSLRRQAVQTYSCLNASIGSIRAARRAGK